MTPDDFRLIRTRLDLTQEQAARRAGVARNTWARWEMGTLAPHPLRTSVLERLLKRAQAASPRP